MRLLLIRHGESEGNTEMRIQGRGDYPLTERGLEQALQLSERLRGLPLAGLYSSPIRRAWLTADVVSEATSLDVTELVGVQEYDFGDFSGISYRELVARYPEIIDKALQGPDFPSLPGAEDREHFRHRVCEALWGLAERHNGASVAVVTHAGPIVVFCLEVLGLPYFYQRPLPLRVHNGSITAVDVRDGPWDADNPFPRAIISTFNDTCHLHGID